MMVLLALMLCVAGCGTQSRPADAQRSQRESSAPPTSSAVPSRPEGQHLAIQGTRFVRADGSTFEWRGISAFSLLEQITRGKSGEAEVFLTWAATGKVTVVRVLAMAHHLFKLTPEEGRAALPPLLEMAARRGLHVEIVALADTGAVPVDLDQHVKALGEIAARHANALIEIANEPAHPTQRAALHDPRRLQQLAALVPDAVPVALGSAEYGDAFSGADYATYHFPRETGDAGWGHVTKLADGAPLVDRWRKPVVSDEPMGAGPQFIPGRRDDDPRRFAAAALLTRFAGLQPTFHYEGGLLAKIPTGPERQCFDAWSSGLDLVAKSKLPVEGLRFVSGDAVSSIGKVSNGTSAFGRMGDREAWLLIIDPGPQVAVEWEPGGRVDGEWQVPGARLFRVQRLR